MKTALDTVTVLANTKGQMDATPAGISNKCGSCRAFTGLNQRHLNGFKK